MLVLSLNILFLEIPHSNLHNIIKIPYYCVFFVGVAVLSERDVLAGVSVIHFVNDFNVVLFPALLPFLIEEFGLSLFEIGIFAATQTVATMLLQLITGHISDKVGPRLVIFSGALLTAFAVLVLSSASSKIQLFFTVVLLGIALGFFHPSGYSFVSLVYDRDLAYKRDKAMGIQGSTGDIGSLVSFASTGFIAEFYDWRYPCFLSVILISVCVPLFLFLTRFSSGRDSLSPSDPDVMEPKVGIFYELKKLMPLLLPYFALFFLLGISWRIWMVFTPLYLVDLGFSKSVSDLVVAFFIGGGIIGAFSSGFLTTKFSRRKVLSTMFLITAPLAFLMFFSPLDLLAVFIVISFFAGICLFTVYPIIYSVSADIVKENRRGFSYAVIMVFGWSGGVFGLIVSGFIAEIFGIATVYLLVFVTVLAASFLAFSKAKIELKHFSSPT